MEYIELYNKDVLFMFGENNITITANKKPEHIIKKLDSTAGKKTLIGISKSCGIIIDYPLLTETSDEYFFGDEYKKYSICFSMITPVSNKEYRDIIFSNRIAKLI